MKDMIFDLQKKLNKVSDKKTKVWFDNYLQGSLEHRGVKAGAVRRSLDEWIIFHQINQRSKKWQLKLVENLMKQKFAEDKLCSVICAQKYLLKSVPTKDLLESLDKLFKRGFISEWQTCDRITLALLCPLVRRDKFSYNLLISQWSRSSILWKRRSSIVAMRSLVDDPRFHKRCLAVASRLATEKQKERFIQTGVGWFVCDLSKVFPEIAKDFFKKHKKDLTSEVLRRHTRYCPK